MLIKYTGPKEVKTVGIENTSYVFNKENKHTVDISTLDLQGLRAVEWLLHVDRGGLFIKVGEGKKEEKLKKEKPRKKTKKETKK